MFLPAALLLALCALSPASAHGSHGLHHGHHHGEEVSPSGGSGDAHATWGASIAWRSLAEGKAEALATGKPLMLLVWKTWCGACKSLRPRFAGSAAIAAAASDVVMVNLVDDEEPTGNDALYKPEGAGYIPRILFYTPSHDLMDITSGNDKFKYFYGEDAAIAANMQQAVARVAAGAKVAEEWEKPQDL